MGEDTVIEYAHDTFNGWIGCTHVPGNPQCGRCYAEAMAKFRGWAKWGDGQSRMLTSIDNWKKPFRWNREAEASGERRRVFAFSLGDVFDEAGPEWPFDRPLPGYGNGHHPILPRGASALEAFLYHVVSRTPYLTWMLFTKRYEVAASTLNALWGEQPWANVWVIFSAGTNDNLREAMTAHFKFRSIVHGISAEPSFEKLNFRDFGNINWVIGGTESGPGARCTEQHGWFVDMIAQSRKAGVDFYMKQLTDRSGRKIPYETWDARLRVRQFPR